MLETDRLILLPSHPDLAAHVAEYYYRNRDFFRTTDPIPTAEQYTEEGQRSILAGSLDRFNNGQEARFWIVKRNDPFRIIGMCALNNIIRGAFLSCLLSYKLDANKVRQGYMTEALSRLIQYAFDELNLHRIEGNVMPGNTPSLNTLKKLGFHAEGIAVRYLKINGVWEDHVHMTLLNEPL